MRASRTAALLAGALGAGAALAQGAIAPPGAGGAPRAVAAGDARPGAAGVGAVAAARAAVEAHRVRLAREIAELAAILAAQGALVEYVQSGGGGRDEGLDPRLCRGSALRALCADLTETFGAGGG